MVFLRISPKRLVSAGVFFLMISSLWGVALADSSEKASACGKKGPPGGGVKRSQVYKGVPFKQGEVAKYELKYGALKVLVGV